MCQYVTVQQYWESPKFHCPLCGAEVFTEGGEPTDKPCEHLLFSFVESDFFNVAAKLEDVIEDEDSYLFPSDVEFQDKCPDHSVLFAFESHGIACGPTSFTVVHAIEFPDPNEA